MRAHGPPKRASLTLRAVQTDVLLVVDVQNDFVPAEFSTDGGRFGVAEGQLAAEVCCDLIGRFASAGNLVLASRDYHPRFVPASCPQRLLLGI